MSIKKRKCPYCKRFHFHPKHKTCKSCQDKMAASIAADVEAQPFEEEEKEA